MNEVRNQIEALLFSSGRAMSVDDIINVTNLEKKQVKKGLQELKEFYDSLESGLMVTQEGDSWKINIREQYVSLVTKIVADTELVKSVLETLSVIAWKSPVLQSEVIKIRTNKAYEHIKELVDAGFVTKEKEGRSFKLRISEKFFEYFDVPGDKGIKEAFKDVKIPEKKTPEKVGDLEVVPIEGDGAEKSETTSQDSESEEDVEEEPKEEIPPVDEEFLDKINDQIEKISKKNDEIEQDELFKRGTVAGSEDSEGGDGTAAETEATEDEDETSSEESSEMEEDTSEKEDVESENDDVEDESEAEEAVEDSEELKEDDSEEDADEEKSEEDSDDQQDDEETEPEPAEKEKDDSVEEEWDKLVAEEEASENSKEDEPKESDEEKQDASG